MKDNQQPVAERADNLSYVSLRHIGKVYENKVQAVFDFSLEIARREFIVFVGPSGCGKSTTLRMIAGLEDITTGELWIDGVLSNDRAPKDRDIAMVFQSYALYPHMSVYDNMAFGLKIRHYAREEIERRVREAARILEIEELLDRKPKALSGGQRQRVALGRAIVRNAKVFLMDEPLSNLDAKLRVQMRSEIIKLHEELEATTIYVTHDQTEAMTMASRIVVMKAGYIQQIGTPLEIYNHPSNLFVAGFIGSPAMNFIDATYEKGVLTLAGEKKIALSAEAVEAHDAFYKDQAELTAREIDGLLAEKEAAKSVGDLDDKISVAREALDGYRKALDGPHGLIYGIRPEDIHEASKEKASEFRSEVYGIAVVVAELLGHEYYVHTDFAGIDLVAKIPSSHPINIHDKLNIVFDLGKAHVFDPLSTKRIY